MSYTNPTGEATYTYSGTTLNTVNVGLSTTETDEYYAQHLLVASGGKLKQNIRVFDGGILENAVFDYYGASVGSGGLISNAYLSGAAASRTTFYVYSGGVASRITMVDSAYISTVLGATLADVIVSGGYFTANGATVTNVTLEKPLHYNTTTLAALGGAVVTNVTINAGTFSLTGATATSVTVKGTGTLSISAGGTATNINVAETGNLVVNSGGTGVTLAGNVVTTATVMGGGYLSLNNSAVVSNIDVRPGGRLGPWAGSIISGGKIVGGNTATQPEIYGTIRDVELYSIDGKAAGGNYAWLRLTANGKAFNMRISSGGKFQINSGTAEDTTVYSAGYIVVYGNGGNSLAKRTVISSGASGVVYAGAGKPAVSMNDTWIMSGASLGVGLSGTAADTVVNPGAILNLTDATATATIEEHPWLDKNCVITVEGATATYQRLHNVYYGIDDGHTGLVSRGESISGATVEAGYSAVVYQGASLTDVTVADGGRVVLKDYAYVMGGSANDAAQGKIYLGDNTAADALAIVDSRLTGLTLAGNTDHSHLSKVTLLSGLTATEATILAGGSLLISNGAKTDGLEAVDGRLYVYNGGAIANATISGAATANRAMMYLTEGAVADHVTLLDNAYASNYKATVNDLAISGGYFTANGVTINGATLDKYRNASNGTTLDAINGAKVSGATVNYGSLILRTGAFASDTTINGGTLNVSGGDAKASGAVLLAGAVSVGVGASLSGAIVRGGVFSAYGVASDVTISNGGVFSAYGDGGTTVAGQKIVVSNGGKAIMNGSNATISDVTVYSGGLISAWSGIIRRAEIGGNAVLWGGGKLFNAEIGEGGYVAVNNLALASGATIDGGYMTVSGGGSVNDVTAVAGTVNVLNGGVIANATVSGAAEDNRGIVYMYGSGAVASNVTLFDYAYASNYQGTVNDLAISGGYFTANGATVNGATLDKYPNVGTGTTLNAISGATVSGATIKAGKLTVDSACVAYDVNATGGTVNVKSGGTVNMAAENTLNNAKTVAGATVNYVRNRNSATIQGADTNIAASTFYYDGATTANGFSVVNGVVKNLGADGVAYRFGVGTGITVENAVVKDNWRISAFGKAVVSGVAISGGPTDDASIVMRESSTVYNAVLTGGAKGAIVNVWDSATAVGTVVSSGGKLGIASATAKIEDTTLKAGGQIVFSAGVTDVDTGKKFTLAFDGTPGTTMNVDLSKLATSTTIYATGVETVGTYTLGSAGTAAGVTQKWGLYENAVAANGSYDDALNEVTYSFDGTALTTAALNIKTGAAAGLSGDNYTLLRGTDRAAKWTSAADNATLVTESFSGDAFLTVAGNAAAAIYGAGVDFAGTVNINAKSGTIRNLAAGAEANKTVGAVKLTFDGATLDGAGYAGGFGSVTGKTETLITTGSFTKDFYAGALANYAKTNTATTVGDINLTIAGGTFSGNIYGASGVKASAAAAHTAGNVTLSIAGGETTKGDQACIFAGGYATGSAADTTVYTVGDIDASVSGGSWGEAGNGRGLFGGAFASGVTAEAQDVTVTITNGTLGNVFGGGWAQKGGTSVADDVEINISGGTVANVFGGGTHSTSGGATTVDDVTITVSGGNITGAIYAGGQSANDNVTGDEISVTFTGDTNFGCGVYGYSYGGGTIGGATLSYSAYTGTFSGAVGGFVSITLDGNTAMTLASAAADVSNGKWVFDLTDRGEALAETSLLTWDNADFANSSISVSFASEAQVKDEWDIAAVAEAFSDTSFDVEVGGTVIADDLAYGAGIEGGDWNGWGFTLDKGVLKFKQLA